MKKKMPHTFTSDCRRPECNGMYCIGGLESKPTHTPTPWKIQDEYEGILPIDGWNGEESIEVCRVSNQEGNMKENAAFIVRAVNIHDDLVREFKALLESVAIGADPYDDIAIGELRKLIAQAEGR